MARKAEAGISYFPLNTDIITNNKIKLIISEYGARAWAVIIPLLCKIYREKGYYIDWSDDDMKLLFAQDECKCDLSFVDEVVARSLKRGLFDISVFEKFGILSSDRIQLNYLEAKRRQKQVDIIPEFMLISADVYILFENVNIIELNVDTIVKKVDTGTQNKRKVKGEGKGDGEGATKAPVYTDDQKNMFTQFQQWLDKYAPRVQKMKEPLTIDQFLKIKEKIPKDIRQKVLIAMQNRADLLKKYVSANLTLQNWADRDIQSGTGLKTTNEQTSDINAKLKAAGKPRQTADA